MNKYICVKEAYEWILIGSNKNELTQAEVDELSEYLDDKKDNFETAILELKYKKIRFINYVGVICLSNVTIEILPKISLSGNSEKDRTVLLLMLSKCSKLPFDIDKIMSLNLKDYSLIDLLSKFFLEHLKKQVGRGFYFEYTSKEENLNSIKGKLLLTNHVKVNYANKVKAYCAYDEYNENNFLNTVLKKACMVILCKVNDEDIKNDVKKIIAIFDNVDLEYIDKNKLLNYKFHRQNNRFKYAYDIAILILLNMSMESSTGDNNAFSMLFEINTLYEEYISNIVSNIWNNENREIIVQDNSQYLINNVNTNKGNFNLKPDIILKDNKESYDIIIDTKWKSANSKIEPSDMYQMYAYITRYTKARKCILLYPYNDKIEYSKWKLFEPFNDKHIEVKVVRLDSLKNTIEDIEKILDIG